MNITNVFHQLNAFRSTPAAVLFVCTMAIFADTIVYGLIAPFLPVILQDKMGMSSSANGILFGCFGVGVLVGSPVSGYISDKCQIRRWPMILGLLGLAVTTVLFAFSNAFWELVVARIFQGISSGVTWSIGLGMIADVYASEEAIGWAMRIAFSGFTMGFLGGPVLGGVIYNAGGIWAIAIFVGSITFVDLVFRLLLIEPPKEVIPINGKETTLWDLLREPPILTSCIASIIVVGVLESLEPVIPIYATDKYHLKPLIISLLFVAFLIPNATLTPIAGSISGNPRVVGWMAPYGRFGFIIIASVINALVIACLGATHSVAGLIVALVAIGSISAIATVPILNIIGLHVHRMGGNAYGKVYGLYNVAASVGLLVIPAIMPPIMNSIGWARAMGILSGILVVGTLVIAIQPTYWLLKYGRKAFVNRNKEFI